MPELPEVEIVRRGLEPVLTNARFAHVEQRRANLRFDFPERFARRLSGQSVERLERRAKYLVAHLSGSEVLLMHLGMTGRFTVHCKSRKDQPWGRPLGNFALATAASARHPATFVSKATLRAVITTSLVVARTWRRIGICSPRKVTRA